jgi:hypothetical protein
MKTIVTHYLLQFLIAWPHHWESVPSSSSNFKYDKSFCHFLKGCRQGLVMNKSNKLLDNGWGTGLANSDFDVQIKVTLSLSFRGSMKWHVMAVWPIKCLGFCLCLSMFVKLTSCFILCQMLGTDHIKKSPIYQVDAWSSFLQLCPGLDAE